jgi:hypothetical protein
MNQWKQNMQRYVETQKEELVAYHSYVIQASKIIFDRDTQERHTVPASLQVFIDDDGHIQLMREV